MPSADKTAFGHNILLLPFPWPSHFTLLEVIGIELDRLGHNVTIAVPSSEDYSEKTKLKRIVYSVKAERNAFVSIAERRLRLKQGFGVSWLSEISGMLVDFGEAVLENGQIDILANSTDLIISDIAFFATPVIATHLKIPWIYLSPFGHMVGMKGDLLGAAINPSYVPVYMSTAAFEKVSTGQYMNFLERSFNLFASICMWAVREFVINRSLDALTAKYGTDPGTVLAKKTSLVLIPMDYAFEYPRMDPPNIKLIGPLTACQQNGELESPFSNIANEADGRILIVSLGITSGLHTDDAVRLLKAVQFINYTVIMKYNTSAVSLLAKHGDVSFLLSNNDHTRVSEASREGTNEYNSDSSINACRNGTKQETARSVKCAYSKKEHTSKNYKDVCGNNKSYYNMERGKKKISSYPMTPMKTHKGVHLANSTYVFDFLPQQKLLQYNENSILLTHCGLNSVYEALYHGRPIICMPLFGDHFESAGRVLSRKLGRVVLLGEINKERLQYELDILIRDKSYMDNVRTASKRLRRRKMSPVEEAAFWIESVLSDNDNMNYLKPAFGHLPLPVFLCLDVILFWLMVVIVLILSLWISCRRWKAHH